VSTLYFSIDLGWNEGKFSIIGHSYGAMLGTMVCVKNIH
jgi:pimeloyl-ACP methyl ester carboxylesterase